MQSNTNWQNKTVFTGDNLPIMLGMNSESVDLIYLDLPFNSSKSFSAPIGSKAAGASFDDAWTLKDIDYIEYDLLSEKYEVLGDKLKAVIHSARLTHSDNMFSYLLFMSIRLIECRRILKRKGSLYLHCDPYASHYLKLILDCIFGKEGFRNEIIWTYGLGGSSKKQWSKKHDTLLFYSKSDIWYFEKPLIPATSQMLKGKMKGQTDVWNIPTINNMSKERTGYPTQKPLELLAQIVKASTPPKGLYLTPSAAVQPP